MNSPCLSSTEIAAGSAKLANLKLGSSRLALGTAGLGGIWRGSDTHQSVDALLYALEHGLNVWDTAPAYGEAEALIGSALKQWHGPLPVISTKIGRTHANAPTSVSYRPDTLRDTLSKSLDRLHVDSVDLLFLHEPEKLLPEQRGPALDTLLAMQSEGLTRLVGLGGGWGRAWDFFLDSGAISAAIVFLSLDACCLDSVPNDVPKLQSKGVAIYGGSPLHMGLLASAKPKTAPWATPQALLGLKGLQILSHELNQSVIELAHRFVYSLRCIDRVLIGPRNLEELKSSLQDFSKGALPPNIFHQIYDPALKRAAPRNI
ncbi:MAG: aldo/keto reductase [Polyangiaceae bacterium]|nr:aldo/keto reductase [Polyangiaceae bacterium]